MRTFGYDLGRVRPKAMQATAGGDPAPHLARNRIWEGWLNAPRGLNRSNGAWRRLDGSAVIAATTIGTNDSETLRSTAARRPVGYRTRAYARAYSGDWLTARLVAAGNA